jgi:regulator of CtrA degradation
MTPRDAHDPKYRLGARTVCSAEKQPLAELPMRLLDLLERSKRLYERVDRMEVSLFEASETPPENPVNAQLMRLQAALGASN